MPDPQNPYAQYATQNPYAVYGAPPKPDVPSGFQPSSGGLSYIPGGPADPSTKAPTPQTPEQRNATVTGTRIQQEKADRERREWEATHNPDGSPKPKNPDGAPLPQSFAQDFQGKVGALSDLQRALNNFRDDYSGPLSGVENTLQGVTGMGTPGQRDWWSDFKRTDNITRNAIFGASLSEGEKSAYQETTITPNMKPEEIKRNLARRMDIARNVLSRQRSFLEANGYKREAIDSLMGGVALDAPQQGQPQSQPQGGNHLTPEQQSEFFGVLKSQGPDAADAYLQRFGLSLKDKAAAAKPHAEGIDYSISDQQARDRLKSTMQQVEGNPGLTDIVVHGATLGLSDEAAGVGNAAANIITSPFTGNFDPVGAYQSGTDLERQRLDQARQNVGAAAPFAEFGGSLASGNVGNALAVAPTLMGRVAQGARAGAAAGGLAGFGYGEGINSLYSAGIGAAGGAGLGAALPIAGTVIGNRVQGLRRMVGADPALPRRIIGETIQADGTTPAAAGQMMDNARGRGSPMMLADAGENSRSLLASVGRQPGASRTITRNAVTERQNAQAERIGTAVTRDLGPTANLREMGDHLVEQARTAAAPLYEKAYSNPGASVVKLDDLTARPAFLKALRNALNLAQEEGANPLALGFRFNEAGDVALEPTPSWQTLDYVKRGLDDVVETYRDKTTGKLVLDGIGRATEATRRTLVSRMDKVNPDYAAARAAYAGPAKMREAMEKGAKAMSRTPDDIMAMMKGMGDAEQDSFRLGVRKAIVDMLGSMRDGGDKVARLLGTPKSRAVLTRVFGGRGNFERFVQTLRDEEAMGATYRAVTGNSATAERLAQDAQTRDTGLAETAMDAALRGGKDGMWSAFVAAVQKLRDVERFGAGQAGERTRESIAALLTETDPAVLRELIRAAQQAATRQRAVAATRSRKAVTTGRNVGDLVGISAGETAKQPR